MMWLKFVHIAALSVWVAGLLYLPALLLAHRRVGDAQDFARIRMASRMAYLGLVSPAAFVAIGAGGALLFVADALHPWMFAKLVAVGALVLAHMQSGHLVAKLAERDTHVSRLRLKLIEGAVLGSSLIVLLLVLGKPALSLDFLPDQLLEPGFLSPPGSEPPVPLDPRPPRP
jgi:protoporphyrinogen IX oxidase